jgi:DNA-binding GntR family transcriptional regulator
MLLFPIGFCALGATAIRFHNISHMPDQRTVLASSVYERLKERIMDQEAPPGQRLNIDALAVELAVSPTPIREALARLAAERLITFEAFKGYRVTPLLTAEQVADLMHTRRLLEMDGARQAARHIMLPDLITAEKIMQRILHESAHTDVGSWSHGYRQFNQLDREFHELILTVADNRFLLGAYRSLNVHIELGRFYQVFQEMDQQQTCVEHDVIFRALKAHDADGAAAAVEAHLHATEERIFRLMDKYPQALTNVAAQGRR